METTTLPTIGEEPHFYGYLTGAGVESWTPAYGDNIPTKLYASFEYGNRTTVWCVPDATLFALLSNHLLNTAIMRSQLGEYGTARLWIRKVDGIWEVALPGAAAP